MTRRWFAARIASLLGVAILPIQGLGKTQQQISLIPVEGVEDGPWNEFIFHLPKGVQILEVMALGKRFPRVSERDANAIYLRVSAPLHLYYNGDVRPSLIFKRGHDET